MTAKEFFKEKYGDDGHKEIDGFLAGDMIEFAEEYYEFMLQNRLPPRYLGVL